MIKDETFTLAASEELERLDKILKERFPSYSRTYFQALIEEGFVRMNGEVVKKRSFAKEGDLISISFKPSEMMRVEPEEIPLDILYEDADLIAINKPIDMVVHPGAGRPNQTFANALLFHVKELPLGEDPIRPGIVHRLDKDTSGILIGAKTERAHRLLVDLFKDRKMEKEYLAICKNTPCRQGLFSAPIKRDPKHREKMCVMEGGKEAITEIQVIAKNQTTSFLLLKPKTGRTHQLRVHLKHLGAPIIGDPIYGQKEGDRLFLHAYRLTFTHPISNQLIQLKAPLPEPFHPWLEKLQISPENL